MRHEVREEAITISHDQRFEESLTSARCIIQASVIKGPTRCIAGIKKVSCHEVHTFISIHACYELIRMIEVLMIVLCVEDVAYTIFDRRCCSETCFVAHTMNKDPKPLAKPVLCEA